MRLITRVGFIVEIVSRSRLLSVAPGASPVRGHISAATGPRGRAVRPLSSRLYKYNRPESGGWGESGPGIIVVWWVDDGLVRLDYVTVCGFP